MFLNSNVSGTGTKRDIAPKKRFDRLLSVGNQIHANSAFEDAWAKPGHTVIGDS